MLTQIPNVLKGIGYYQGFSLILWIIAVILLFLAFILSLIKARNEKGRETRFGYLAIANFCFFFSLCRLVYIFSVYDSQNYVFYVVLGYVFSIIAIIFILYLIETQVITQTKKVFTIITLVLLGIAIITLFGITTRAFALNLMYLIMPFSIGVIMLMYIYIIFKSTGKIRNKAFLVFLSIALIFLAHLLDSEFFISLTYPYLPLEITPLMMDIGIILYTYSNLFYKINKSLKYQRN